MSNQIQANTNQEMPLGVAKELAKITLKARKIPFLRGKPGIGKTAFSASLAREFNLKLIDFRLTDCDPTDFNGFAAFDSETKRGYYAPMENFPIETDTIPQGYKGWLISFDELPQAEPAIQKAAYKVLREKQVGLHNIHPKCAMIAFGNREEDNAFCEPMSSALQTRVVHFPVTSDYPDWMKWAEATQLMHHILSFLRFKPQLLNNFNPETCANDLTYACERSWEDLSDQMKHIPDVLDLKYRPIYEGTIGRAAAAEFCGFLAVYNDLPDIQNIIANPETHAIPSEPAVQFALTGALAHHTQPGTFDKLLKYICRMSIEFQVITMREIGSKVKEIKHHPSYLSWMAANQVEIFGD